MNACGRTGWFGRVWARPGVRRAVVWGGMGLIGAILIAAFCIAEYIRKPNLFRPKGPGKGTPADIKCEFEDVAVTAPDGAVMAGWYIPHPDAAGRTLVMLHGINSNKSNMLDRARRLRAALPINLCLMDLRSHGNSDGDTISYGVVERRDIKAVIDYLAARKDVNPKAIGILGESLGADVAMQTAGEDPRVAAVVSQAAFTDLRAAADDRADRLLIPRPFVGLVRFFCEIRTDWDWDQTDVRPVVAAMKCPAFFIHGEKDASTRPAQSEELHKLCGSAVKELWIVPGAGHSGLTRENGDEYAKRVADFLRKALPGR